jgi:hypothetical protein
MQGGGGGYAGNTDDFATGGGDFPDYDAGGFNQSSAPARAPAPQRQGPQGGFGGQSPAQPPYTGNTGPDANFDDDIPF